jgi:hypothetical protein
MIIPTTEGNPSMKNTSNADLSDNKKELFNEMNANSVRPKDQFSFHKLKMADVRENSETGFNHYDTKQQSLDKNDSKKAVNEDLIERAESIIESFSSQVSVFLFLFLSYSSITFFFLRIIYCGYPRMRTRIF